MCPTVLYNNNGIVEGHDTQFLGSFWLIIICFYLIFNSPVVYAWDWQNLDKGLDYLEFNHNTNEHTVSLHVLRVDPKFFEIKPVYNEKNTSAKNLAKKTGALAVINANFFDPQGKALGLVKRDNHIISPNKNISWWSVLCVRGSQLSIIHSSQIKNGYCYQAVQAGPRLVIDGQIPKLKDEWSQKSAVGITSQGDLILLISESPIPIKDLAQIFKRSENDSGLDCRDALNLDGGSSSQMFVETDKFNLNIQNYAKIPVGLAVFKR